jgi:hypothetical protein
MKRVMAGMDLHGNNVMIGIVDADGTRLRHRRLACDLEEVIAFLNPYKPLLDRVAVELRIPTQTGHQSDLKSDSVPIQSGQRSD